MLGTAVLTVTAAATPKVTRNPSVIKVADLDLELLGNPSLKIPVLPYKESQKGHGMHAIKEGLGHASKSYPHSDYSYTCKANAGGK